MKYYDYKKAKDTILNTPGVLNASLGMAEDWFWTGEEVYKDGAFVIDLDDGPYIAGIKGSDWATPILRMEFADDLYKDVEVFKKEDDNPDAERPWFALGTEAPSTKLDVTPDDE